MSAAAGDDASTRRHLSELGRAPRPAGGAAEAAARAYAATVLRTAGFTVTGERFAYSAFPGRWGTPVGGVLAALTVLGSAAVAHSSLPRGAALAVVVLGLLLVAAHARAMLGDAVLDLPWLRAESVNLVATRGVAVPDVWLVAHLDSKSQPISSAWRVAGVVTLAAALGMAAVAAGLRAGGVDLLAAWWAAVVPGTLGGAVVAGSTVGDGSPGALDNASGVAAVLAAAERLPPQRAVGVLLPSAEELGLAGARAWARRWGSRHPSGVALNCDGVDDRGPLTLLYSGALPASLVELLRRHAPERVRARRMPLGLLTDSVALADHGWRTVTVSRGDLASLRRVHSARDSLAQLTGVGLEPVITLLVGAVEALA